MSLRPIHSTKHIVDLQGGVVGATKTENTLIVGVDNPDVTSVTEVQKGARVNAIYLNVQVIVTANTALKNIYMMLYKNPANLITAGQIPNANVQGTVAFKKQVFHTEMRMGSDTNDSIPITLFNGVLRLPKQFRSIKLNDTINLQLFSPGAGNDWDFCIQCIYKEYT